MRIKGIARTGKVYLDGVELLPAKSLGYARFSPKGFAWGDESSGSKQLALAICLEFCSPPISAIDKHEDFMRQYIAPQKMGQDFEFELHTWKTPLN